MIQKPILALVALLALAASSVMLSGCQPSCDNLPTESLAQVRILNAVSNSDLLLIYVDGKLFDSAWYDLNKYASPKPDPIQGYFGYRSTYLSDGSRLRAGLHQVVAIDNSTRDSVVKWSGLLYDHRQSLIVLGRMSSIISESPKAIYLNDVVRAPDVTYSYGRFIDAIPDLSGMDVYFSDTVGNTPNIHLTFGTISDAQGGNNGTGLSANDYVQIPLKSNGILIMPAGDRDTNDNIFSEPYSFSSSYFLSTVVVRGSMQPVGKQPNVSVVVIEDGEESTGTFSFNIQDFGVRILNATRYDSITLLISSSSDQHPEIPRSVGYAQFSTQQRVTDILRDSTSEYMALSTTPNYFDFWFGPSTYPFGTVFGFTTNPFDAKAQHPIGHIIPPVEANQRLTFVAIDTIPNDVGTSGTSVLELFDSVSVPPSSSMGRVRFVNTSADYTANFSFAGENFHLPQRGVGFADAPVGHYSFVVSGGAASGTISFDVIHDSPVTVFFLPLASGGIIPYSVIDR